MVYLTGDKEYTSTFLAFGDGHDAFWELSVVPETTLEEINNALMAAIQPPSTVYLG